MASQFYTRVCGLLMLQGTMIEAVYKFTVDDRSYIYFPENVPYLRAMTLCSQEGFHLAFFETPSEAQKVHAKVSDNRDPYWIGLIRESKTKTNSLWRWSSSLSPVTGQELTYFTLYDNGERTQSDKDKTFVDADKWVSEVDSATKAYVCEEQNLQTSTEKTTIGKKSTPQSITTLEKTTTQETTTQEKTTTQETTTQETTTQAKTTTQETTTQETTTQAKTTTQETTTQAKTTTHASPIASATHVTTRTTDRWLTITQESATPERDTTTLYDWTSREGKKTEEVASAQQASSITALPYSVPESKPVVLTTISAVIVSETLSTQAESNVSEIQSSTANGVTTASGVTIVSSDTTDVHITTLPSNGTRTTTTATGHVISNVTVSRNCSTDCRKCPTDALSDVVTLRKVVFNTDAALDDPVEKGSPMFTASDRRPSAIAVGSAGIFILIAVIAFIILLDVSTVRRDLKMLKRNLNCAGADSDSDDELDEKKTHTRHTQEDSIL